MVLKSRLITPYLLYCLAPNSFLQRNLERKKKEQEIILQAKKIKEDSITIKKYQNDAISFMTLVMRVLFILTLFLFIHNWLSFKLFKIYAYPTNSNNQEDYEAIHYFWQNPTKSNDVKTNVKSKKKGAK